MQQLRLLIRRLAPLALAFAVLAALGPLLAPAGWMPAADGRGFVLCSGRAVPAGDHRGTPLSHGDQPCAFAAAAGHVATPPQPLPPQVAPAVFVERPRLAAARDLHHPVCDRAHPATGPPRHA